MYRSDRCTLVVVALLTLPIVAEAQNLASIAGVVRDASGAVLPGVTVEASSPALIEKQRVVITDATGQYRIEALRPGTYSVTLHAAGILHRPPKRRRADRLVHGHCERGTVGGIA